MKEVQALLLGKINSLLIKSGSRVTDEDRASLAVSIPPAERGGFATEEEMRAISAKQGFPGHAEPKRSRYTYTSAACFKDDRAIALPASAQWRIPPNIVIPRPHSGTRKPDP